MGAVRKASSLISWKSTGRLQQTLAGCVERTGMTLHSGRITKVRLCPLIAGKGRCFDVRRCLIPASIDYVEESPLCTTLTKDGVRIRTVEHLLSALEAYGVDNCRIEVEDVEGGDVRDFEVPIFDGSAKNWVEAIEEVGLEHARDDCGNNCETMTPYLCEPVHVSQDGSFFLAFPSPRLYVNCGINFPQAASIGCQWFTSSILDYSFYKMQIAPARTFCIFEEVEEMRQSGLIKGGSLENALVCSAKEGWLNPPLRFDDEPARHKALDLIGDLSLLAQFGSQGLPVAHLVAYKSGHRLHTRFLRSLL